MDMESPSCKLLKASLVVLSGSIARLEAAADWWTRAREGVKCSCYRPWQRTGKNDTRTWR